MLLRSFGMWLPVDSDGISFPEPLNLQPDRTYKLEARFEVEKDHIGWKSDCKMPMKTQLRGIAFRQLPQLIKEAYVMFEEHIEEELGTWIDVPSKTPQICLG